MPTYNYRCVAVHEARPSIRNDSEECGHEYEVFYTSIAKMEAEEPNEVCPSCGGTDKERIIKATGGHILKGKGWARDNYS